MELVKQTFACCGFSEKIKRISRHGMEDKHYWNDSMLKIIKELEDEERTFLFVQPVDPGNI